MPEPHRAKPATDRVTWTQLIAFGSGGLVPVALFNIAGQLIGVLGNISLGLSAFWLGTIMIIPRLWDAVSDPIVGYASDHTRTRWGRRRPYILVGGVLVALSFVTMWWTPRGEWVRSIFVSDAAFQWFQLAFILCGLLVFYTACTIFEIPHGALGMEMSGDYHERTRLFSAKSFLGNLFAVGTPWLLWLAGREVFCGPGGDLTDGMRYVSLLIAVILIPLSVWWFRVLEEPRLAAIPVGEAPRKSTFWRDMSATLSNRTFLRLVASIFVLAMGFNFVSLFSYYITIFYLYSGDAMTAARLLGIAGTTWAVVALAAVLPLNWLSRRLGKHRTLLVAIALMSAAQVAKIRCYDPSAPYLILIPTGLLSMGMLMFFTLASAMIADVCDADELATGKRAEGTFYSVFWWFLKMGSAFASFVTGVLLVYTHFDETQNVAIDALQRNVAVLQADAEAWQKNESSAENREARLNEDLAGILKHIDEVADLLTRRAAETPSADADHLEALTQGTNAFRDQLNAIRKRADEMVEDPATLAAESAELLEATMPLKSQSPKTLYRLRLVEIGLPLLLSCVSVVLLIGYPLTEARCYEIKELLEQRRAAAGS